MIIIPIFKIFSNSKYTHWNIFSQVLGVNSNYKNKLGERVYRNEWVGSGANVALAFFVVALNSLVNSGTQCNQPRNSRLVNGTEIFVFAQLTEL